MNENLLICMMGLPRSGKTTACRELSQKHGIPMVNPDSVRLAIHGERFILEAEQFVWATVNAMIRSLFLAGHGNVLLDATNITRKRRDVLKFNGCQTVFHHIDTAVEICKLRAADDAAILPVIDKMNAEFEPLQDDEGRFEPIGSLGTFSQGSCQKDDEGDIRIAIAADAESRLVRIEFGKPVGWLALPANDAVELAKLIVRNAEKLG